MRLKDDNSEDCSVSTDVESAVPLAESPEVRYELHSMTQNMAQCVVSLLPHMLLI